MILEHITRGERLITAEEIAKFFNVHLDTVLKWINAGLIEAIKINRTYRITEEELTAFIERHKLTKTVS
jgi:excisionase family DNA binding protein